MCLPLLVYSRKVSLWCMAGVSSLAFTMQAACLAQTIHHSYITVLHGREKANKACLALPIAPPSSTPSHLAPPAQRQPPSAPPLNHHDLPRITSCHDACSAIRQTRLRKCSVQTHTVQGTAIPASIPKGRVGETPQAARRSSLRAALDESSTYAKRSARRLPHRKPTMAR